jgi:hypothetical protein
MKGNVAYHADMKRIRPMYIDSDLAKKYKVRSTVLLLQVSPTQAKLFLKYRAQLKLNPGALNLFWGALHMLQKHLWQLILRLVEFRV